jgi:enoyl-CoA hydratase/carnithine racemase
MSVRLPERIGHPKAKELTFTGLIVDGRTAAEIGLVDRCATDGQLDIEVHELTGQIVANSTGANRICKQLYARSAQLPRSEALATERSRPFGLPTDAAERLARPGS